MLHVFLFIIQVNLEKHKFAFGSAAREEQMIGSDEDSQKYRACYFDNFQWSVFHNAHKWPQMERQRVTTFLLPPGKIVQKVLFWAASVFFSFFMFVGTLSLKRLDRSQSHFHTRWRGELAQILLEMGIVSLTVSQPSGKNPVFTRLWLA